MITFSTPRLLEKGIARAYMELDPDTSKVSHSVKELLKRHHFGSEEAQPFIVTIHAYDLDNRQVVLGKAEGVHHKKLPPLILEENYRNCQQMIYLNLLFVESAYEKCGIATSVLEYLPVLINVEMGASIEAIILSPVPQYKSADGRIEQIPFGIEFLVEYRELVGFYTKCNFSFCQSISHMGKRIA